jgi:hypothetical protein
MREMFAGAFSICRNPSAHREVQFAGPREVIDSPSPTSFSVTGLRSTCSENPPKTRAEKPNNGAV